MIRKRQREAADKRNVTAQNQFIAGLLGLALSQSLLICLRLPSGNQAEFSATEPFALRAAAWPKALKNLLIYCSGQNIVYRV
jgi:hypothetical protein